MIIHQHLLTPGYKETEINAEVTSAIVKISLADKFTA